MSYFADIRLKYSDISLQKPSSSRWQLKNRPVGFANLKWGRLLLSQVFFNVQRDLNN